MHSRIPGSEVHLQGTSYSIFTIAIGLSLIHFSMSTRAPIVPRSCLKQTVQVHQVSVMKSVIISIHAMSVQAKLLLI